ncbi:MAG: FHA domain-containing protein [Lentisphaeria bacterium]|nr:FHA domain-containing protein [Lentisphaeria bacterium]
MDLVVLNGEDKGKRFSLDRNRFLIGRELHCTLRLVDETVSREHAELRKDDDGLIHLKNLSGHGTVELNGDKIKGSEIVCEGDKIKIQNFVLSIEATQGIMPLEEKSTEVAASAATMKVNINEPSPKPILKKMGPKPESKSKKQKKKPTSKKKEPQAISIPKKPEVKLKAQKSLSDSQKTRTSGEHNNGNGTWLILSIIFIITVVSIALIVPVGESEAETTNELESTEVVDYSREELDNVVPTEEQQVEVPQVEIQVEDKTTNDADEFDAFMEQEQANASSLDDLDNLVEKQAAKEEKTQAIEVMPPKENSQPAVTEEAPNEPKRNIQQVGRPGMGPINTNTALITANVEKVAVYRDGQLIAYTPFVFQGAYNSPVDVTIKKRGYEDQNVTLKVDKQKVTKLRFDMVLKVDFCIVDSKPSDATLRTDTRLIGQTPIAMRIDEFKDTSLRLVKDGYKSSSVFLTAKDIGQNKTISLFSDSANFKVGPLRQNMSVYLDGQLLKKIAFAKGKLPAAYEFKGFKPGVYNILIKYEDGKEVSQEVELVPQKTFFYRLPNS